MKKIFAFQLDVKQREIAKRNARIERKFFGDYSEEAYIAGVELKEFARANQVSVDDVLFYLKSSTNGTDIRKAQR